MEEGRARFWAVWAEISGTCDSLPYSQFLLAPSSLNQAGNWKRRAVLEGELQTLTTFWGLASKSLNLLSNFLGSVGRGRHSHGRNWRINSIQFLPSFPELVGMGRVRLSMSHFLKSHYALLLLTSLWIINVFPSRWFCAKHLFTLIIKMCVGHWKYKLWGL